MTQTTEHPGTGGVPPAMTEPTAVRVATQTLDVLVENTPWALTRITALFSRRRFDVASLKVHAADRPDRSRVSIDVVVGDRPVEQMVRQLEKLVNVLQVTEQTP